MDGNLEIESEDNYLIARTKAISTLLNRIIEELSKTGGWELVHSGAMLRDNTVGYQWIKSVTRRKMLHFFTIKQKKMIVGLRIDNKLREEGVFSILIMDIQNYDEIARTIEEVAKEFSNLFSRMVIEKAFS